MEASVIDLTKEVVVDSGGQREIGIANNFEDEFDG